jgi:hypothetical protein
MTASAIIKFAGSGWFDCELRLGERNFAMHGISDLTDVFGDLLRFGLMIATGAHRATVSFDREPAEWRLVAVNLIDLETGLGPVSVSVFEFSDCGEDAPLDAGHQAFIGDCGAVDFARAILTGVNSALNSSDAANLRGFYPYPAAAIRALEAALETNATTTKPRTGGTR